MVGIRWASKALLVLLIILTLSGCGELGVTNSQIDKLKSVLKGASQPCMGEIEWVDFLMINNIRYHQNFGGTKEVTSYQHGDKVGEVSYMLSEHACTNHVMKNGDAAFFPIDTDIYAVKGYKIEFRVIADNKIYEVSDNPNAATIGDLLDIEGRVEKVSLESGMDGSPIGDFSMDASSRRIEYTVDLRPGENPLKIYHNYLGSADIVVHREVSDPSSIPILYNHPSNEQDISFTKPTQGYLRIQAGESIAIAGTVTDKQIQSNVISFQASMFQNGD